MRVDLKNNLVPWKILVPLHKMMWKVNPFITGPYAGHILGAVHACYILCAVCEACNAPAMPAMRALHTGRRNFMAHAAGPTKWKG